MDTEMDMDYQKWMNFSNKDPISAIQRFCKILEEISFRNEKSRDRLLDQAQGLRDHPENKKFWHGQARNHTEAIQFLISNTILARMGMKVV